MSTKDLEEEEVEIGPTLTGFRPGNRKYVMNINQTVKRSTINVKKETGTCFSFTTCSYHPRYVSQPLNINTFIEKYLIQCLTFCSAKFLLCIKNVSKERFYENLKGHFRLIIFLNHTKPI